MEEVLITPRRKLGTGRYDKKLIERMVALSVADDYEEAHKEWMATGNVYWGNMELPEWWQDREGECLCGHKIVYHFEVENTENGEMILVGSDHINSYQILRQIALAQGIAESMVTDEMIDEWMKAKVESMKQTAWWHHNGTMFTTMFNDIKEYDVRVNVRVLKYEYDSRYGKNMPVTALRKAGKGSASQTDYQMASIVWRWNHPDNPKAQINTRGYPTDKLYNDLIAFWSRISQFREQCEKEDEKYAHLLSVAEKHKVLRGIAANMIQEEKDKIVNSILDEKADYYGLPNFSQIDPQTLPLWEANFLRDMRNKFMQNWFEPSENQMRTLAGIVNGEDTPSTWKQHNYLKKLGYEGDVYSLGRKEASSLIDSLLEKAKRGE
jgi:hypothetical protein